MEFYLMLAIVIVLMWAFKGNRDSSNVMLLGITLISMLILAYAPLTEPPMVLAAIVAAGLAFFLTINNILVLVKVHRDEEFQDQPDEEEPNTIFLQAHEEHGQIYLYELPNLRFVCQGVTAVELWGKFQLRYPNTNARIIDADDALLERLKIQCDEINRPDNEDINRV